jgi:hypothetical protein
MAVAGVEVKKSNRLYTEQEFRFCLEVAVTEIKLISTEHPTNKTESRIHGSITRTTLSVCVS